MQTHTITLFESIKEKITDGWSDDRLVSHYDWVNPVHLKRLIREVRG